MRFWSMLAMAACLAACTSRPVRTELPPAQREAAEAAQAAREAALRAADPTWSLAGRIAVSNGRDGGSGRIDWRQAGERYEVSLSAPVTRQSWRLSGDATGATLEGLEGGPRAGADAAAILYEATGWNIPILALADWVRGARSDALGPTNVEFGADGRLSRIEQGGWTIDYRWPEAGIDGSTGSPMLPSRLDARRGEAKVRLIIDHWGDEGG
jgi:outer membrane lipoprotein LolB